MVSDSVLVGRLREFLSTSDLNTTTNAAVRRKLEEDFDIDLSDRKVFIREQVNLYLESHYQLNQENEKNEEEMEEENDEVPSAEVKSEVSEEEEEDPEEEDPEEEEEEEEESEAVAKVKRKSSKKKPGKKNENVKRKAGGFTKVCSLSPQLQKITGEAELARTEVVKRMWNYIRENNLQDPSDRRNIKCDDILRELFNVDTIGMFQMNKALSKHIWPLDSDGVSTITTPGSVNSTAKEKSSTAKKKRRKQEEDEDSDEPKRQEKRKNSGILAPLQLSDALINFLGTGESELSRSNVVKRIWEYIKHNNLQFGEEEQRATLKKKRGRTEIEDEEANEEEVEEQVHEHLYDVVSSSPRTTQEEEYHFMPTPGLSQQHYEPFGPAREPERDPDIRPQVIYEDLTKLKIRMNQKRLSGNRVISFKGDHAGIIELIDLPYSPTKLTWKGKEAVTSNQLEREREREKKVGKLKTRKANGRSQI